MARARGAGIVFAVEPRPTRNESNGSTPPLAERDLHRRQMNALTREPRFGQPRVHHGCSVPFAEMPIANPDAGLFVAMEAPLDRLGPIREANTLVTCLRAADYGTAVLATRTLATRAVVLS